MKHKEPKTIGLTLATKPNLARLVEDGYFNEQLDAYKFAVALALKTGRLADPGGFTTIFNIGTIDLDREIYESVKILREYDEEPVYKTVERLAEWGVNELFQVSESGDIDFSKWLK